MAPPLPSEVRRPIPADTLAELTPPTLWKIDAPAHLSNNRSFSRARGEVYALKNVPTANGDLNKALSAPPVLPGAVIGSMDLYGCR
jgi:hypothetical protein